MLNPVMKLIPFTAFPANPLQAGSVPPDSYWNTPGLSMVESASDAPRRLEIEEGPDHVLVVRTQHRCRMQFDLGQGVMTGESGPGQFFLLPPQTKAGFDYCGRQSTCILYIKDSLLEFPLQMGTGEGDAGPIRLRGAAFHNDPLIRSTVTSLLAEFKGNAPGRATLTSALARVLAVHLVRRYAERVVRVEAAELPPYLLKRVLEYIDQNCRTNISLRSLAALTKLSPHYFLRLFKTSTGITPYQYMLRRRIEMAKIQLTNSQISLADLALDLGFPSQSHFGTIFKKVTGVTPKKYRLSQPPGGSGMMTSTWVPAPGLD